MAGRDLLFGSRGKSGFSTWGYSKPDLDRRLAQDGHKLAPWSFHTIRHTVRTRLGKLGIPPYIAELVINHASHKKGIGAVYDHYDYDREIKDALARWAIALAAIVDPPTGSNVTVLAQRITVRR
jgi:hypothetical protein